MARTITGTGTVDASGLYAIIPDAVVSGTSNITVEGAGTVAHLLMDDPSGSISILTHYTVEALAGATAILGPDKEFTSAGDTVTLVADGGTIGLATSGSWASYVDSFIGTVEAHGTLDLSKMPASEDAETTVTFGTGGGLLEIGGSLAQNPTIRGFGGAADMIDDTAVKLADVTGYMVAAHGGGDTVTFDLSNGKTATVTLAGATLNTGTFTVGSGPLNLTHDARGDLEFLACFLAGTLIQAENEAVPVERLAPGDLVRTADGACVPVRWIGHRTVWATGASELDLAPVRIAAGAIAPGLPRRDLWVTPDHGILVDGHLVPARLLVNGASIRSVPVAQYTYFHVELDRHAILLAEGLGAESYLETGNRAAFANSDVVTLRLPTAETQAQAYAQRGCMNLTLEPSATRHLWTRLAERSATLGSPVVLPRITREPDLVLGVAAGRTIRPIFADTARAVFTVPHGTTEITILSRATPPWTVSPWIDDRRRLGLAINRIVVRGDATLREIALDSPALTTGWFGVEHAEGRAFRWTQGDAHVSLPHLAGPMSVEIGIASHAAHLDISADQADRVIPLPLAV